MHNIYDAPSVYCGKHLQVTKVFPAHNKMSKLKADHRQKDSRIKHKLKTCCTSKKSLLPGKASLLYRDLNYEHNTVPFHPIRKASHWKAEKKSHLLGKTNQLNKDLSDETLPSAISAEKAKR